MPNQNLQWEQGGEIGGPPLKITNFPTKRTWQYQMQLFVSYLKKKINIAVFFGYHQWWGSFLIKGLCQIP